MWGRTLEGGLPAGAAFGSFALNFLGAAEAGAITSVHRVGRWMRLSSQGGFTLVRS